MTDKPSITDLELAEYCDALAEKSLSTIIPGGNNSIEYVLDTIITGAIKHSKAAFIYGLSNFFEHADAILEADTDGKRAIIDELSAGYDASLANTENRVRFEAMHHIMRFKAETQAAGPNPPKPAPVLKLAKSHPCANLPSYATDGSAAMDIETAYSLELGAGAKAAIGTNLLCEAPEGYELQIRSRSGLAARHGIHVLNSPATIDSDYRGELIVILHNTSDEPYRINVGDRIAQIILKEAPRFLIEEVEELSATARGEGGLGSTGR